MFTLVHDYVLTAGQDLTGPSAARLFLGAACICKAESLLDIARLYESH